MIKKHSQPTLLTESYDRIKLLSLQLGCKNLQDFFDKVSRIKVESLRKLIKGSK